ncbi:hypothetical protein V9K67_07580 [Paraflavisolibacter sp. H34]|uniref:hypothetical protein n=1 Tax=Huijunlia imazamoxiresistens TaxID=3127457 RepID=UPI00301655C5
MSYLKNIFTTGAVRETPKRIISRLVAEIAPSRGRVNIIEIGAGKGEITAEVVKRLTPARQGHFHVFEIDEAATGFLKQRFPHVQVHHSDAFHFAGALPGDFTANYIISSIPLSFYKKEQIRDLLATMLQKLDTQGKIIILFSAPWLIPLLSSELPQGKLTPFLTFPPYFLYTWQR